MRNSVIENQAKIQDSVKNTDFYDLIKHSLRPNDSKKFVVEKFIQRALERQQNQSPSETDDERITMNDLRNSIQSYQIHDSDDTQIMREDSPIKENMNTRWQQLRNSYSPSQKKSEICGDSRLETPLKKPFQISNGFHITSQDIIDYSQNQSQAFKQSPGLRLKSVSPKGLCIFDEQILLDDQDQNYFRFEMQVVPSQDPINQEINSPQKQNNDDFQEQQQIDLLEKTVILGKSTDKQNDITPRRKAIKARAIQAANYAQSTMCSLNKQKQSFIQENDLQYEDIQSFEQSKFIHTDKHFDNLNEAQSKSSQQLSKVRSHSNILAIQPPEDGYLSSQSKSIKVQKHKNSTQSVIMIPSKTEPSETREPIIECQRLSKKVLTDFDYNTSALNKENDNETDYKNIVQQQIKKVVNKANFPKSKKKIMLKASKNLNLSVFVDLGRIKKPQKHAFIAGRILCLIVNTFKDKPLANEFNEWHTILYFINQNINKFSQEVSAIVQKVSKKLERRWLVDIEQIKDAYFSDNSFLQFLNQCTDKNIKAILVFVQSVVSYVIWKHQGKELEEACFQSISGFNIELSSIANTERPTKSIIHDEITKSFVIQSQSPFPQNSALPGLVGNIQQPKTAVTRTTTAFKYKGSPKHSNQKRAVSPVQMKFKAKFLQEPQQQVKELQKDQRHNFVNQRSKSPVKRQHIEKSQQRLFKDSYIPEQYSTNKDQSRNLEYNQRSSSKIKHLVQRNKVMSNMLPTFNNFTQKQSVEKQMTLIASNYLKVASKSPMRRSQIYSSMDHKSVTRNEKNYSCLTLAPISNQKITDESTPSEIRNEIENNMTQMSQMIIEKSYQIEENMKNQSIMSKTIDLSIIEELKRRRLGQRVQGQQLEQQREDTINQVQQNILSQNTNL